MEVFTGSEDFPNREQRHRVILAFLVGTSFGLLCCLLSWTVFVLVPRARRHPAIILMSKLLCDTTLMAANIYIYVTAWASRTEPNTQCQVFSAVYQFCYHASNSWFLLFAADLYLITRNPFNVRGHYYAYYHFFAWGLAAVLVVLAFVFSDGLYATSENQLCWLSHNRDVGKKGSTELMVYFFPFHMCAAMLISLYVMVSTYRAFKRGFPQTHETRSRVIKQTWSYLVIFGLYLVFELGVWLATLSYVASVSSKRRMEIVYVDVVLLSCQGLVDCFAVFRGCSITSQDLRLGFRRLFRKTSMRNGPNSNTPLLPSINAQPMEAFGSASKEGDDSVNQALRRDLLLGTAFGILESVKYNKSDDRVLTHNVHPPPSANKEGCFQFKNYYSACFAKLRQLYGVRPHEYAGSFVFSTQEGHQTEDFVEQFTEGGSGSFFFFTHDRKYIVKTVSNSERQQLEEVLEAYRGHLSQNPDSLLCRLYGLYGIRISEEQQYFYFVVMNNVFSTELSLPIHRVYDLKGSWVNRTVLRTTELISPSSPYKRTLRDGDVVEPFHIGMLGKAALVSQIVSDVMFLNKHGLMDYSLLVGVHTCSDQCTHGVIEHNGPRVCHNPDAGKVFCCGIVDITQGWTTSKKMERFLKVNFKRADAKGISCVPPDEYAIRFQQRIREFFC